MTKHIVKCKICGESFDLNSEQGVRYNCNRYAHLNCYPQGQWIPILGHEYTEEEQALLEKKAEPTAVKKPEKKNEINKPVNERRAFTDYVQQLFGDENCNWGIIAKQMKQYIEEYKYTYSGMQKTLEWYYVVQKHPKISKNGGIGIIPFNYRQAYNYFYKIYQAEQLNKEVERKDLEVQEVVVKKPTRNTRRKVKLIDMEDYNEE